jgi:hypothetical protein
MYCPTCGTQSAKALSYCKHCGANLRTLQTLDKDKPAEKTIDSVVWVIVGTTITILGMCLGALVLMSDRAIDVRLGTVFVILSFVALVLVEGVLVWRLVHLNRGAKDAPGLIQAKDSDAEEPGATSMHALSEPAVSVMSVTEHTTRVLEPSYSEDERA